MTPPDFNDGKMARFALRANSLLILGVGRGRGLFSYFILSKIGGTDGWEVGEKCKKNGMGKMESQSALSATLRA